MIALAPGEPMTGGVVSTTVIVWLTGLLVLPQASVAVQVRVMLYVPGQTPGVVTSTGGLSVALPQVSLAVGVLNVGSVGHSIVEGPPTPLMVGLVLSTMVIV